MANDPSPNPSPNRRGRQLLFLLIILLLILAAFKFGQRGSDVRNWFAPPTATPTVTATDTATATETTSDTATETPTETETPTPVPKTSARKIVAGKVAAKAVKVVVAAPAKPTATPLPESPGPQPICTVTVKGEVQSETESNDVFYEAQNLGSLGAGGQMTVAGNLSAVGVDVGSVTGSAGHLDPKSRVADLDRDVFEFAVDTSGFKLVLDCYTTVTGSPNPATDDNDYQLEVYDENFIMVGSSIKSDPVEFVDCEAPGNSFYAVVYGFSGNPGKYRLTLIK